MNTSFGKLCQSATTSNTCREKSVAMQEGILWADMVRAAGIEDKLFHTKSAGNRDNPAPDMRDTQTSHAFASAATMTDMVTADGTRVSPLTNTMVVERLDGIGSPREINCLNDNSFVDGHISAIGTDVYSLSQIGGTVMSGTSMAAPQVAGLAAYMLAIDDSLTPQKIKEILLDTAQVVPIGLDASCSDWPRPAPAIDAYAAVLSVDEESALSGSIIDAPVRNAILDVSNNGTDMASNSRFDEFDLMYYLREIDQGTQDKKNGIEEVKYSRVDLNGDGFDGGGDGYKKRFNLDLDYPPTYTVVTQSIEGENVAFNEASLSDNDILCYYAYSDLYTGSIEQRRLLVAPRCRRGVMAVYFRYYRDQVAVPSSSLNSACESTPALLTEERETLSTRPMRQTFPTAFYETRPAGHYWAAGDTDTEINIRNVSGIRRFQTGFVDNEPVCVDVPFATETEFNATLEHDPNGNRLNLDVLSRVQSDCQLNPDDGKLNCAESLTQAAWQAEFDYAIRTPLNLQLIMQLSCSATSDRVVADPDFPNPDTIGNMTLAYSTSRYDYTGERISTAPAQLFSCPENGIVDIVQDINLAAPATAGTTDNIVIRVSGQQQVSTPYVTTVEGSTFIENRINGFVEVRPGD